jgi:formylglycine-generating enzyme required for sulfatase activity
MTFAKKYLNHLSVRVYRIENSITMKLKQVLLWLLCPLMLFAKENPETISPKTKEIKPIVWYSNQAELWKNALHESSSSEAWINYYAAKRYAQASNEELNKIAADVEASASGSYESLLIQSWNLGFSNEGFQLLTRAYATNPEAEVAFSSMIFLSEFNLDLDKRKEFSKRLWQSGQISSSLLNYSYNVLMSLDQNAILFTEGDNTTIPIFILQDVFNVRRDVSVLNLELITQSDYRTRKLSQLNLKLKNPSDDLNALALKSKICEELPEQNTGHQFYYALTISKENISTIKDQLYVVGLASQISKDRLDNISLIKKNLEHNFLIDYLIVDFNGENEFATGKILQANYLVPMLMLYEHYKQIGETERIKKLESLLVRIADESGKSSIVNNFLNRDQAEIPFIAYKLDVKNIEGSIKQVKGNLYASDHEVTNEEFNTFLNFLTTNNLKDQYEKYKFDLSNYTEPALSFMKNYSSQREVSKKEKYFTQYPAVSISYEAAVAYCEWLTDQYNNTANRKFKKIKIRLPDINEWQVAALGYKNFQSWNLDENVVEIILPKNDKEVMAKGEAKKFNVKNSDIQYPWYRAYNYRNKSLNSRGCSLGNFKYPEGFKPCKNTKMNTADGFMMMSPVQAYFPNDMGLYDVVGNVAEMTREKGKACGGSWNQAPEESTIRSISEYKEPDSAVGFRIFMEVIEQ